MTQGKIVILSGPSGAGKTTLYKKLLAGRYFKNKLVKIISVTTRPKREGERQGRDYFFVNKKEFLSLQKSGQLLEWQKVFNHYYGSPKYSVEKILDSGKNALLCIDVKGAKTIAKKHPRAVTVFIKPPTVAELQRRLLKRKTEGLRDLRLRIKVARQELKEAKNYSFVVINDDLQKALTRVRAILKSQLNNFQ